MLYIKKHGEEVMEENLITDSKETDVLEIAHEIEMECAMFSFEVTHSLVEAYEVEVDKTAGVVTEDDSAPADKSIWQKIKDFIGKIIAKIKELFTRFVNWLSTKILSNDKFLERFKGQKLGKIKAEAYDYEEGFKRVKVINSVAVEEFNVVKKAFNEIMATGKHTDSDELKKILDESKKRCEEIAMKSGKPDDFNAVQKYSKDFHEGYFEGTKQFILTEKKERELDGNKLLKILEANKDIKNTLQKVSTTFIEQLKFTMKAVDGLKEGNTDPEVRVYINYTINFNIKQCQATFQAAQILIASIRSHISACAKAAAGEAN